MVTYNKSEIPFEALTEDIVDSLVFHSTPGALRRAISVNENITVPESKSMPEIVYYQETAGQLQPTDSTQWLVEPTYSAHVLDTDVLKYLLKASLA